MTQWVGDSGTGRPRGPGALVRAWAEVLVRPRRFFASNVVPGDQAPGVTFLAAVVLVEEATRHALVADTYEVLGGRPVLTGLLWVLVAAVLVAPAGAHLVSALQTVLLMATTAERGGVSETVQVLCYATAPCLLAGAPDPRLRLACALYGAGLYVVGLAVVHELRLYVALGVGAVPAALVFGAGFGGAPALFALLESIVGSLGTI